MFWRGEDHDDCCALAQRVDELLPASLRVRMSAVDLAEMRAEMEAERERREAELRLLRNHSARLEMKSDLATASLRSCSGTLPPFSMPTRSDR